LRSTYTGLAEPDDDDDPDDGDVSEYGPGVAIYFDMMLKLFHIFILFTIISIPMMITYGLVGGNNAYSFQDIQLMLSFGNMGFPQAVCSKSVLLAGDTTLKLSTMCQGTTLINNVYDSGMFSQDYFSTFRTCSIAKPVNLVLHPQMAYFDQEAYELEYMSQCAGKQSCEFETGLNNFLGNGILAMDY
jgi:hypothetical protein